MELPEALQIALKEELLLCSLQTLQKAQEELSTRYRDFSSERVYMTKTPHRLAYLASRMPATYAAIHAALMQLKSLLPDLEINSLLDMGAGPGTALWAVSSLFPELQEAFLVEQDAELIAIARRLLKNTSVKNTWVHQSMQAFQEQNRSDLVIFSYSIGELRDEERLPLIEKALKLTNKVLVIIEPGTPAGFARIKAIRTFLIESQASLIAPCPNERPCPMTGSDWCHFSQRLERSKDHRQAKKVSLGFEDEKFSYIIAAPHKIPFNSPKSRILRHPQKRSGHLNLVLCTEGQVVDQTISKKEGDAYKLAKKLEWGDAY